LDYVLYELPMIKGMVLYSWAVANDPLNRFGGVQMINSYSAQEADILLTALRKAG
jgi:hypothetical protein